MPVDTLERLAAANPVAAEARERLTEELRLAELQRRIPVAPPRSVRRRVLLAAATCAALAAAVVLVAPALGLRFGWIDFLGAEHAPPLVVKEFASSSEGAPPGMDPHVIPGETRKVTAVDGHTLWVAPTQAGGFCFEWTHAVGGCDKNGDVPLAVSWIAPRARALNAPPLDFPIVAGHVHAPTVDAVEIRLSDGSTVEPDVTWVSPPIDAGFFFYGAPKGLFVRSVIATKHGAAVAADDVGMGRPR